MVQPVPDRSSSGSNIKPMHIVVAVLGCAVIFRTLTSLQPQLFGLEASAPSAIKMDSLMAELIGLHQKLDSLESTTLEEKKSLQEKLDSLASSNATGTGTSVAATLPAATAGGNNGCQERLDGLDKIWDLRRKGRLDFISAELRKDENWVPRHTFDLFEPEAVCLDDERFGDGRYQAFGDGPKFVCGVDLLTQQAAQKEKNCLVYNVGSNNEISFERAVYETMGKGCEVHTFDPTVMPYTYKGKKYSVFHDWGFGANGKQTEITIRRGIPSLVPIIHRNFPLKFTEMSLQAAYEKLGHHGRTIDIFKIDCEGCEYAALTEAFNAVADGHLKIDQVQVELHGGDTPISTFPLLKVMFEAADRANMRVFHKERNGWGCEGYGCIEYAFASSDFLRKANGKYVCG